MVEGNDAKAVPPRRSVLSFSTVHGAVSFGKAKGPPQSPLALWGEEEQRMNEVCRSRQIKRYGACDNDTAECKRAPSAAAGVTLSSCDTGGNVSLLLVRRVDDLHKAGRLQARPADQPAVLVVAKSAPLTTPWRAFLAALPCSSSPIETRNTGSDGVPISTWPAVYSWFAALMICTKLAGFRLAPPISPPSSSSQSPLRSQRPGGHFSLRSLAPPLPSKPVIRVPMGSRFRRGRRFTPGSPR